MAERYFLDTNVLLYSLSADQREVRKRDVAIALIDKGGAHLSTQVLQEFIHQATRTVGPFRLSDTDAAAFVRGWRRFPVQEGTLAVLQSAMSTRGQTGYSIWDALIVAAAQALGCNILYTEDMQDGRIINGLRIVNPFREGAILP